MTESELLHQMRELENHLFSRDFDRWAKTQPNAQREQIRELRTKVYALRTQIETQGPPGSAEDSAEATQHLERGLKDLRRRTFTMERLVEIEELVDRLTCTVLGIAL
jgi:hypothetical protein